MTFSAQGPRTPAPAFFRNPESIASYCREIRPYRSLTTKEECLLGFEIQKGNRQALKTLVEANLKFVVAVCNNYIGRGLPFGDLVNEGNLGLIRAAQRFDGAMNFRFISYAVWWIRQGILTALASQGRSLNTTTTQVSTIRAVNLATRKLEQVLQRSPTMEELAAETGKTLENILLSRSISAAPLSMDHSFPGDRNGNLGENMKDANAEASDRAADLHLIGKKVKGMLESLGERERSVLSLYYGIGKECEYTLEEISERHGLTRERIRQIKARALDTLYANQSLGGPRKTRLGRPLRRSLLNCPA